MPFSIRRTGKVRFSEIIPVNPFLFMLFRAIRLCFGEHGRMADWTRNWKCLWMAVILRESHKGKKMTSHNRQALVDWEHELFTKPKFDI